MRGRLIDYSKGDDLHRYWKLFRRRERTENKGMRDFLTFCLNRMAHRHGGYIGNGAQIRGIPSLPHGLHGVYISRYASIGEGCRICGMLPSARWSTWRRAHRRRLPFTMGPGAVIIGGVTIGDNRKDWERGPWFLFDVPDDATVVAQPPLIYRKEATPDDDVS